MRWQVETNLRHLKHTMGLDVLHCQRVLGIFKELTVFALVYNLVRVVMPAAAKRQGVALERISFIDALRWLSAARPGERFPWLSIPTARAASNARRQTPPQTVSVLTKRRREARKALLQQSVGA